MFLKILRRAGIGFPLGIMVGNLISALSGWPDGFVTEKLLAMTGGMSAAVLLQTLLSGLLGAVSFGGTVLYDLDRWPLLRIAVVHYLIIEAAYIPISLALGWIVSATEALICMAASAVTYLIIFLIMWAVYHAQVKELNELNRQRKHKQQQDGGTL